MSSHMTFCIYRNYFVYCWVSGKAGHGQDVNLDADANSNMVIVVQ